MNHADFEKPTTPGTLEHTTFRERLAGGAEFRTVEGKGYVPHPLPAGLTRKLILDEVYDDLAFAESNLARLDGFTSNITNPSILMGPFARKEAKHSSEIENTFASEEQLVLFDIDATSIDAEERPDVHDVSNYLRALRQGYDDERPICLNLIKDMHATLLKNSLRMDGRPGEFRKTQNAIGNKTAPFKDAKFVPPPPRYLPECLDNLEKYIHEKDGMPQLVKIAMAHYQFECIHPFDDGNGRIGRLLVALQLAKAEKRHEAHLNIPLVYVSSYLNKYREDYYDLLYRVSSEGVWTDWIRFFLSAISSQALDAHLRAIRLDELRTKYIAKVQKKRSSAMLPKLVDALFTRPGMTVARAREVAGVSQPTAGELIRKLVDAGILRERTGRRHYRVFVAHEILDIMTKELKDPDTNEEPKPTTEKPNEEAAQT